MEHDEDDPVPPSNRYNQYWYVFKATFPTNVFWFICYLFSFSLVIPYLKGVCQ